MRFLFITLIVMIAGRPLWAASDVCESLFIFKSNVYSISPYKERLQTERTYPQGMDVEVANRVKAWYAKLAHLGNDTDNHNEYYDTLTQISNYAAELIMAQRNKPLEHLIESIPFPVNAYPNDYYQNPSHLNFFAQHLLERALVTGNEGAVTVLFRLLDEGYINTIDAPRIRKWTPDLVRAVEGSAQLKRFLPRIVSEKIDDSYHAEWAQSLTLMTDARKNLILDLERDPTPENLMMTMTELLPPVTFLSESSEKHVLHFTADLSGTVKKYEIRDTDQPSVLRLFAMSPASKVLKVEFKNNELTITTSHRRVFQKMVLRYDDSQKLKTITITNGSTQIGLLIGGVTVVLPEILSLSNGVERFR